MTYICRWCDNNFEEFDKKNYGKKYGDHIVCCPRCGNITYGFLIYKDGNWRQV